MQELAAGVKDRNYKYRVLRKNCVFFTIHCNSSLAYIAVRDLQSSQRSASVQSLLFTGNFLYNQKQPSAVEGEVANFQLFRILKKNTIFNEHPVAIIERTQICMCNVFIVFQNLLIHGLVDQNSRLTL